VVVKSVKVLVVVDVAVVVVVVGLAVVMVVEKTCSADSQRV
jgi:hypothetical protein